METKTKVCLTRALWKNGNKRISSRWQKWPQLQKCQFVTKVPYNVTKVPNCYKSALSNVTKVPQLGYKSALGYKSSLPWLQKFPIRLQKFPFLVTKVPIPMALSLSLSLSGLFQCSSISLNVHQDQFFKGQIKGIAIQRIYRYPDDK